MLWLWAVFSVFIIIAFVRFLALADENNVTSIHYDQLIQILTTLDVISMLALPDFWLISLSAEAGNTAMFLGGYSAVMHGVPGAIRYGHGCLHLQNFRFATILPH